MDSGQKVRQRFEVRLGKAYWDQGFFNVSVKYDHLFGKDQKPINIFLGNEPRAVVGYVNRRANPNGTPRIMAPVQMKEWIRRNGKLGGTILVEVLSNGHIQLRSSRLRTI